jgi:hypothetical protein
MLEKDTSRFITDISRVKLKVVASLIAWTNLSQEDET